MYPALGGQLALNKKDLCSGRAYRYLHKRFGASYQELQENLHFLNWKKIRKQRYKKPRNIYSDITGYNLLVVVSSLEAHSAMVVVLSCSVAGDSLGSHGLQPTSLLWPWNFPSKNTVVGCHFLLQGIFPIQGSNSIFCIGKQILYH